MSKTLDWSRTYKGNFDDRVRKAHGQTTYKQFCADQRVALAAHQEAQILRKSQEPILKQLLLDCMVNRKPIQVLTPITHFVESTGITKSNQDDEFPDFYNSTSSQHSTPTFRIVEEIIPAGTELIFKSIDKTLGQWIFKGSNEETYAIYSTPVISLEANKPAQENPGFYGLLWNTHLKNQLK